MKKDTLDQNDFHKSPAAMRRVQQYYEKQGLPKDQALAKTVAFFKKLQSSPNPILAEASKANLKDQAKRKKWSNTPGSRYKEAGGDVGVNFKKVSLSNKHHDGDGKFASQTRERERILKIWQNQHLLSESGIMDEETREVMKTMNKAANE